MKDDKVKKIILANKSKRDCPPKKPSPPCKNGLIEREKTYKNGKISICCYKNEAKKKKINETKNEKEQKIQYPIKFLNKKGTVKKEFFKQADDFKKTLQKRKFQYPLNFLTKKGTIKKNLLKKAAKFRKEQENL